MGGRGTWSTTYKGKTYHINVGDANSKGMLGIVDDTPDMRDDIQKMFIDELGVTSIGGTQDFNQAVIGAYGIQLKNLERKYGAIGASNSVHIVTADGAGFKAAVGHDLQGNQVLYLNPSELGNIGRYTSSLKSEQQSGFKMPTSGTVKNQARYTITHEYGHMLQNAMYRKAVTNGYKGTQGQYARDVANEVTSEASKRYNAKKGDLSSYGASNSAEFFAEAFANANLGSPNAIGKAMNDWLRKNGF